MQYVDHDRDFLDNESDDFDMEDIGKLALLNMRREQMLMYIEDIRNKFSAKNEASSRIEKVKPQKVQDFKPLPDPKKPGREYNELQDSNVLRNLPPSSYENVITFEGENFDVLIPTSSHDKEMSCLKFGMIPRIFGCILSRGMREEKFLFQITVKAQKTYEKGPWESYLFEWRDLKERRKVGSLNISLMKRIMVEGSWLGIEFEASTDRGRGVLSVNCLNESMVMDYRDVLEFLVDRVQQRRGPSLKWGDVY